MKTKLDQVKDYAGKIDDRILTVNFLHRTLTGSDGAVRWHQPIVEVSKSTIRRALDELAETDGWEAYYPVGHCCDEKRYRKVQK